MFLGVAGAGLVQALERVRELAVMHDALHALTRDGEGHVVVVSGEAGIGKSALVGRFVEGLGGGVRCWLGRCDDLFVARPLGPVLDIARQAGGRLRELCEAGDPAAVFEGFLDELTRRDRLTVFVLEELQWADMATLDLVRFVDRRVGDLGVLVILTHRDDIGRDHPLRRALGGLAGGRMSRVRLGPLSEVSVRGLVGDRPIDPVRLHAATGGNPFFIAEKLAHNGVRLPESVREAVIARVAGLSPGACRVLDAASVRGSRVAGRGSRGVLGRMAGDVGDVDEVADAQLLVAVDDTWSFRHDRVRQSVEESRPPAAGYGLLVDAAGIACIDMPGMGAMGVHYVNGSLVGDAVLDPLTPC